MVRATLAASEELVDSLDSEAKKRGLTLYSLTNTSLASMIHILRMGKPPETLQALVKFAELSEALRLVPVTDWFIENLISELYKTNKEKMVEICEKTGEQLATFLTGYAPTLEELMNTFSLVKLILPLKSVYMKNVDDTVVITIVGSGFNLESTECSARIAAKVFQAYGLKVQEIKYNTGGVILLKGTF
ncbi:MAG: hypothetical protein ACP5HQ_02640 [Thermoprotei archaeon]